MTSLLESIASSERHQTSFVNCNENKPIVNDGSKSKHVVTSKENIYKSTCSKAHKRKLKKYKLRRDGKEDQEVLNISNTLLSSLKIISPNKQSEVSECLEIKPNNYLFKMARGKNITKSEISDSVIKKQNHNKKEDTKDTIQGNNNEEKKQTNAFKLLMDSRNKSIGSNSPGKDKVVEHFEIEEIVEKKTIKAKRNLVLQKLAEAKGSIKKKELDEYQESCIKFEMEKRAEKLKSMLMNKDGKIKVEDTETNKNNSCDGKTVKPCLPNKIKTNGVVKQSKTLKLVNIFGDPTSSGLVSPVKKLLPKEDEEFLKKLSPSMRKKENMLCYFNKVEKLPEDSPEDDDNKIIIKVKPTSKGKKRGRKKKGNLNHDVINVEQSISTVNTEHKEKKMVVEEILDQVNDSNDASHVVRKRKRVEKAVSDISSNNVVIFDTDTNDLNSNGESRPKRSVKKPLKYSDDIISGSDEDLHIFTPKKKKVIENRSNSIANTEQNIKLKKSGSLKETINSPLKKTLKLAPIFATKTQTNLAAIEAKLKFLHSGVPEQLKKCITQQKQNNENCNDFFVVVHVQQKEITESPSLSQCNLFFEKDYDVDNITVSVDNNLFGNLIKLTTCDRIDKKQQNIAIYPNIVLQNIKQSHPMFPVFRTFRTLRDKRKGVIQDLNYRHLDNSIELINGMADIANENPDKLIWTDKYKATSSKQIIGNFESIKELKKFLEYWTKNEISSKTNGNHDTDSSDFCESDPDSRDGRVMNNLLVLTGPVGSGKTSSVYAIAAELAMKVIEVNASNKRTGKIMLQDLQEATQSHKVNRNTENSQKSQEVIIIDPHPKKKRGRPKKYSNDVVKDKSDKKTEAVSTSSSQEIVRTAVSLILIDDADIVFEQDDGFTSAIVQLVQYSKRPVILVTASLACPHLQRFVQTGKILTFNPLSPKLLGTWLDIMCLADNGISQPGLGAKLLNYFKGDIRKTINCLQFYISTHNIDMAEDSASKESEYCSPNFESDENSSISWADRENWEADKAIHKNNTDIDCIWKCFLNKQINLFQFSSPLNLVNIWWTLPSLFGNSNKNPKNNKITHQDHNKMMIEEMDSIATSIDTISLADYFSKYKVETDITSQPWDSSESDNVSELENLDLFNKNSEVTDEISYNLINRGIDRAQHSLDSNNTKADIYFPGMTVQRKKDRIISRHKNLTNYLNPLAVFDRRALALDYWPSCRNICRIEKAKPDISSKRNNRFCHYLKSLNVQCKNDTFNNLCDSLDSSGKCDWNSFYE